jgi:CheY-like chemotaxis protein
MPDRVLFVDDEPSLLNGIQRRLGPEYDVVTASSGDEALQRIAMGPPFPVVVTDMRMPKMNGIQLIKAARAKSPDSVFIMLTGNQDQATAIHALNEGDVYRFLTKPCQSHDLTNALEAAFRQHRLITSERELLQNTFLGAVSVLTDVLELAQPSVFGRAERVQEVVGQLQEGLGLESRWEYKLAARLALLGFALLPEQDRIRFEMGLVSSGQLELLIGHAAEIGRRIIERIPRLGNVARIIGSMSDVDGGMLRANPQTDLEKAQTGATLVRVAVQWDFFLRQGLSPRAAADELAVSLSGLPPLVTSFLAEQDVAEVIDRGVQCELSELAEGMVLLDDVLTNDGVILVRGGRRLTWTIIEKLRSYKSSAVGLRTIRVRSSGTARPESILV